MADSVQAVTVEGLRELQVLFSKAGKEANSDLRSELRELGEPIRADAESLAATSIRRVGPKWSRMRVGVTRRLVYVAPKQRGVKRRGDPRARPKFGTLLEQRAMTPALRRNEGDIATNVNRMLERLAEKWTAS